jgi:hypothetical protein
VDEARDDDVRVDEDARLRREREERGMHPGTCIDERHIEVEADDKVSAERCSSGQLAVLHQ